MPRKRGLGKPPGDRPVTFAEMLLATIVGIAFPPAYFAVFGRKGR